MMVEPGLLGTICRWELKLDDTADATDDMLKAWIHEQVEEDRSSDVMIIRTMRVLVMNEKIASPAARDLGLVQQWDKIVRDNGW
jgi:hypothetical protein